MNTIKIFFQDHWKVMLIGLLGVILGVILNNVARSYENKKLLESLTTELTTLQNKSKTQELTAEEKKQIETLNMEIYILKFKCK